MLTTAANVHHSRLPRPGEIVRVRGLRWRPFQWVTRRRGPLNPTVQRFVVEAYNLSDSADPRYSRGIHLVHLRSLRDGRRVVVAGHWCEECS